MSNPDITMTALDLDPDYSSIGDRQPGLMLSARRRNGSLRRPFQVEIYGLGTSAVRELTVEDVIALRDYCAGLVEAIYAANPDFQEAAE